MLAGIAGRTALVTGAGGEIGAAMCRRLAAEGARVVAVDIDGERAAAVADEIGPDALAIQADVSDPADTERYVRETVDRFGSVDLFAANAGVECAIRPVVDFDPADFQRVYAVNVLGSFLGAREVTRRMVGQPTGGSILFTASMSSLKGGAGVSVYSSSKHAVLGISRSLALEVAGDGIRVNALCPAAVDTRMMRSIDEGRGAMLGLAFDEVRSMSEAGNLLHRYATAEEVAATAVWVLSDECRFMHNEVVTVSGGGLR